MPKGNGTGRIARRRRSSSSGWFPWGNGVLAIVFMYASGGDAIGREAGSGAASEVDACPQFPQKRVLSGNSNPQK